MAYDLKIWALILAAVCSLLTGLLEAFVLLPPSNTAVVIGSSATLYCAISSGDPRDAVWTYGIPNLNTGCTSAYPGTYNVSCVGNINALTVLSASSITAPRIYTCADGQNFIADGTRAALVALSAPPTCGLPNTTVIAQGQQVTLPCQIGFTRASFDGVTTSISMSWSLNGTLVSGSQSSGNPSSTITVTATGTVFPSYTCTSLISLTPTGSTFPQGLDTSNISLSCTTTSFLLRYCPTYVNITPSLPPSGQFPAGSNFSCTSDGYLTPTYTWIESVSGRTVNGTTFTLPAGGGPFTLNCTATGNVPGVSQCSKTSSITGYGVVCSANTSIIDPLNNVNVANGSQVQQGKIFGCSATSAPLSSYYWSLDGGVFVKSDQYRINELGNHTLTCISAIDNTTLCGNLSSTIVINVIVCPTNVTILDVTSNSTVANGSLVQVKQGNTYSCSAISSPTSSYSWFLNGVLSANRSQYTITALGRNSLTCQASLANTTLCSNPTSTLTVNVIVCPSNVTIFDVTSNTAVANGTQVQVQQGKTYNCSANSSPTSSYSWFLNGNSVANSSQFTITALGRNTLTCQASLANTTLCSNPTRTFIVDVIACPSNVTIFDVTRNTAVANGSQVQVQQGKTYNCSANSSPTSSYSWFLNGVSSSNSSQYTITAVGRNTLTCQASLANTTLCSNPTSTFTADVIVCPSNVTIVDVTDNSTVANGSLVQVQQGKTYRCSASSSPTSSYSWFLDGVLIANSSQYTITSALSRSTLTCQASLANTTLCSNPTSTITVSGIVCPSNVTIVDVANSSTVANGSQVQVQRGKTYNCSAISTPTSLYSWFLNGVNILNGSLYTITALDRNTLTCRASIANTTLCSNPTSTITVDVIDCPSLVVIAERISQTAFTNGSQVQVQREVTYNCLANGYPTSTYSWFLNGVNTANSDQYTVTTLGRNTLTCQATLPNTALCSKINTTLFVDFIACPSNVIIFDVTSNTAVANGSQVQVQQGKTYNCSANSSPTSSYSWFLNGVFSANSSQYTITAGGRNTLTCQASLANTALCSNPTSTFTVDVTVCPSNVTIFDVTNNSTVANGSQVQVQQGKTYSCAANSSPTSLYSWFLNGVNTVNGSQYTITTLGRNTLTCQASLANTSCSNPTSTVNVTVFAATTMGPSTTVMPTTSAPQTTVLPTTSAARTTVLPATSASQTTALPTTSASGTTVLPTTSASQTTALPTTSAPQTTAVLTTSAPQTTQSQTTSSQTITVSLTNAAELTSGSPSETTSSTSVTGVNPNPNPNPTEGETTVSSTTITASWTTNNETSSSTTVSSLRPSPALIIIAAIVPTTLGLTALAALILFCLRRRRRRRRRQ